MNTDNKNTDKWLQNLRARMEGYTEPQPDGLWEKLENELNKKQPVHIIHMRQWIATAASVAAILIAGYIIVFQLTNSEVPHIIAEQPTAEFDSGFEKIIPPQKGESLSLAKTMTALPSQSTSKLTSAKGISRPVTPTEQNETIITIQSTTENNDTKTQKKPAHNNSRNTSLNDYKGIRSDRKKKNRSVGASISNGFSTQQAGSTPTIYYSSNMMGGSSNSNMFDLTGSHAPSRTNEAVYDLLKNEEGMMELKHHTPITFGVNTRFELTERLSIESGVTYTQLNSDCKYNKDGIYIKKEQVLHYIGVPVKLSYKLWNSARFSTYSSAGFMLEKCVSATMETSGNVNGKKRTTEKEDLDADNPQFSLTAAIGGQYNFSRRCGLYVEPGIIYHFDDSNPIETIRKEHPFNFNLEVGFRVNF